jgi:hypothetical protein
MLPVRRALDDTEPCQPPTVSMPVRWLRNFEHDRGAIMATLDEMSVADATSVGFCNLPVILSSGSRCHRDQLAHGSEDTKVTNPHDNETVDNTSCATVVETLSEEN